MHLLTPEKDKTSGRGGSRDFSTRAGRVAHQNSPPSQPKKKKKKLFYLLQFKLFHVLKKKKTFSCLLFISFANILLFPF